MSKSRNKNAAQFRCKIIVERIGNYNHDYPLKDDEGELDYTIIRALMKVPSVRVVQFVRSQNKRITKTQDME